MSPEAMVHDLKEAGLKATGPRRKILEIFEESNERHLSAEDIYRRLVEDGDHIGLATVYRVLTQFESAGLLVRHHLDAGKSVFEMTRLGPHNHLVCLECGMMKCFVDKQIEKRQAAIASELGFEIADFSNYTYANCINESCIYKKPKVRR